MIGGSTKSQECLGKFRNVISELYPKIYIYTSSICVFICVSVLFLEKDSMRNGTDVKMI